jgi:hypothetical protein
LLGIIWDQDSYWIMGVFLGCWGFFWDIPSGVKHGKWKSTKQMEVYSWENQWT